jgi:hypothetical protein
MSRSDHKTAGHPAACRRRWALRRLNRNTASVQAAATKFPGQLKTEMHFRYCNFFIFWGITGRDNEYDRTVLSRDMTVPVLHLFKIY